MRKNLSNIHEYSKSRSENLPRCFSFGAETSKMVVTTLFVCKSQEHFRLLFFYRNWKLDHYFAFENHLFNSQKSYNSPSDQEEMRSQQQTCM